VGGLELQHEGIDGVVHFRAVLKRTGNDQRSARLVDQDRVDLVDNREVMAALHHLGQLVLHVVAQIVEAELVVGGVGDVAGVAGGPYVVGRPVDDDADGKAEELVDASHPARVARGQVVVDGNDVHAFAGKRVEVDGQGRNKGFAFARAHFGDAAVM